MTDCSNVEMREQLPDLVSGLLSRVEADRVEQHVSSCAECSDELMILRTVYAVRPASRQVDVAAIVAALPKPAGRARKYSNWQRWRAAAAIATIAIGGMSWQVARHGGLSLKGDTPLSDSAAMLAAGDSNAPRIDTGLMASNIDDARQVAVSFGGLGDYTDEELEQILDRIEKWDGATSTEPLHPASSPLLPAGSGGSR